MNSVLVDSNVLLDTIIEASPWADWSMEQLDRLERRARLVINAVIFAEVSIGFPRIEDLEAALSVTLLEREDLPFDAAFLAGKAYLAYKRRGGVKTSPLPDFLIGAHAAVAGHAVLTRDPARYRTYFPQLEIIAPD